MRVFGKSIRTKTHTYTNSLYCITRSVMRRVRPCTQVRILPFHSCCRQQDLPQGGTVFISKNSVTARTSTLARDGCYLRRSFEIGAPHPFGRRGRYPSPNAPRYSSVRVSGFGISIWKQNLFPDTYTFFPDTASNDSEMHCETTQYKTKKNIPYKIFFATKNS